jgi:hypothetical protein
LFKSQFDNQDASSAQLLKIAQDQAGGNGYTPMVGPDGRLYSVATPGGSADPATIRRNTGAEAGSKAAAAFPYDMAEKGYVMGPNGPMLAPSMVQSEIDKTRGNAAAAGEFEPVKFDQLQPDGTVREVTTTKANLPSMVGGAANAGVSSGAVPGPQWAARVAQTESGNRPQVTNPMSTAGGPQQFVDPTFQEFIAAQHPELAGQPLGALKQNPALSAEATLWNARRNAPILQGAGLPVNSATLGLAHTFGGAGAVRLMTAPPAATLAQVAPDQAARNPTLAQMPVGRIAANWQMNYGTKPVDLGQSGGASAGAVIPGKPVFTPEAEALSKAYGEQAGAVAADGNAARAVAPKLQILANAQNARIGSGTLFAPGAGADTRLAAARMLASAITQVGGTPPEWLQNGITGSETVQKEGVSLATAISKGMGREPGFIVSMIAKNLPNTLLSQGGYAAILSGLGQEAQRKVDLSDYQDEWLKSHTSVAGMQSEFNKQYPPEAYASRVVPFPKPSNGKLIPNVRYVGRNNQTAIWDGSKFQPVTQ